MVTKQDAAGRRSKTKGEPPLANYADKEVTQVIQNFSEWLTEQTGYQVDPMSVYLGSALRGQFQKSDANQERIANRAVERVTEAEAREQREAKRTAAAEQREKDRAERKAAREQAAAERKAAAEAAKAEKDAAPKANTAKATTSKAKPAAAKATTAKATPAARKAATPKAAATKAPAAKAAPRRRPAAAKTDDF